MKKLIVYIHGKGGNAAEAEHFRPLFENCEVIGLEYRSQNPWDAKKEFFSFFEDCRKRFDSVWLIANSIGACFSMYALSKKEVDRAFFISPIVDLKELMEDMMLWEKIDKKDLQKRKTVATAFGETLSWDDYCNACNSPVDWDVPTEILYGENDCLIHRASVERFARDHAVGLTIMEGGEHWFHTEEQLRFLDDWITEKAEKETV